MNDSLVKGMIVLLAGSVCGCCALLTHHVVAGFKAGSNMNLTQSPVRVPKLNGAAETQNGLAKRFDLRTTGAALSTMDVRSISILRLKNSGHAHLWCSHVLDPEAQSDPAPSMCTRI